MDEKWTMINEFHLVWIKYGWCWMNFIMNEKGTMMNEFSSIKWKLFIMNEKDVHGWNSIMMMLAYAWSLAKIS